MGESVRVQSVVEKAIPARSSLHPARRSLLWINVLGGIAVLGSYAHGLSSNPLTRDALWGEVPEAMRPLYSLNMLFAAAGYLAFSAFVLLSLDPERTRVAGRFGYGAFHALYALILLPSALWMPLTFAMIEAPSAGLWLVTRAALALVGLGALGMIAAVATASPHGAPIARRIALVGTFFFALQTAVLDALVWTAWYPA